MRIIITEAQRNYEFYGKNIITALQNASKDELSNAIVALLILHDINKVYDNLSMTELVLEGRVPSEEELCKVAEVAISAYCESNNAEYYIDNMDIDKDYYIVRHDNQTYIIGGDFVREIAYYGDMLDMYRYLVDLLKGKACPQDNHFCKSKIEESKKANFLVKYGIILAKVDYQNSQLEIKSDYYQYF